MDTICAISTAYGLGGIAVVRVSGEKAIELVDELFAGKKHLTDCAASTAHYGRIERNREILDEVVTTIYRAPHSFTGEDVVEISCHGSLFIQQELLRWLIDKGCRLAKPGEFTQRAFINGRMDLTQAEAVADLIAAQSKAEKDLALSQLRGSISSELGHMRDELLHLTSLIELELDFADHEELEFADRTELHQLADTIERHLAKLIDSFQTGNAIRNGVPVAIVGATNAGKSTLLNALVGEERAIVSEIRGTTRDTIEDTLVINGVLFRLIDTAGIRETEDQLENMGIERSRKAAQQAQIILEVMDATHPVETPLPNHHATIIRVYNKADLITDRQPGEIYISAKHNELSTLREQMVQAVTESQRYSNGAMISNTRHYEALVRAHEAIIRVQKGMQDQLSGELLDMDLQDCIQALGEITGQITSQEVLNNIFSKFCIGK